MTFSSNQDTLELIDLRAKGIFAMIDEECVVPQGSDVKLANKMYSALQSATKFSVSSTQKVLQQFCIKHYAGSVVYSTAGFIVRTVYPPTDTINTHTVQCMTKCA